MVDRITRGLSRLRQQLATPAYTSNDMDRTDVTETDEQMSNTSLSHQRSSAELPTSSRQRELAGAMMALSQISLEADVTSHEGEMSETLSQCNETQDGSLAGDENAPAEADMHQ